MDFIKQYGLRRTGTNYIRRLIDLNFKEISVLVHLIRSKHGQAYLIQDKRYARWKRNQGDYYGVEFLLNEKIKQNLENHLFQQKPVFHLISVKKPYSWIWSYHNHFLKNQEKTASLEIPFLYDLDDKGILLASINRWNTINKGHISFYNQHSTVTKIIQFEDLLNDFHKVLMQIAQQFKLTKSLQFPINEDKILLPGYHKSEQDFINKFFFIPRKNTFKTYRTQ